mgnify:CR=1 FL=1
MPSNTINRAHAPQAITALPIHTIRQHEGLYCLNDLHKASGGQDKHRPTFFFRSEVAKAAIAELEREFKTCENRTPYIIRLIGKGKEQGTYVCKELAILYGTWVSPSFQLKVIRGFMTLHSYTNRINSLTHELNEVTDLLSRAGRFLCIGGKQVKPDMERDLTHLISQQQLTIEGI